MPLVTVLIPAYNAAAYIRQAVESVLGQTERGLEVVVVDDCSTDGTAEIVDSIAHSDERVRLIRNKENKGASFSRNAAIEAASSQWIALLDADDWYDHDRLKIMLQIANQYDADMVADNMHFVEGHNTVPWRTLLPVREAAPQPLTVTEFVRYDMIGRHATLGLLQPIIRADFLENNRITYDEDAYVGGDFIFLMNCYMAEPRFVLTPTPLYYYRSWHGSITANRTIGNLINLKNKNDELVPGFAGEKNARTRALIRKRSRSIDRYIRYRRIIEPLKAGEWLPAAGGIARGPAIVPFLIVGLTRLLFAQSRKIAARRRNRG